VDKNNVVRGGATKKDESLRTRPRQRTPACGGGREVRVQTPGRSRREKGIGVGESPRFGERKRTSSYVRNEGEEEDSA